MQFTTPIDALEWFVNHRMGGGEPVGVNAMVAAVDIEAILKRFPVNIQKTLIRHAYEGVTTQFTKRSIRLFKASLDAAGYLKATSSRRFSVAA